jgi:hypothetical protein
MVEKIRRLVSFKNVRFLKVMTDEVVVLHAVNYCRSYVQWCAAAAKEGDDGQQRQQQEIKIEQQQSTAILSLSTLVVFFDVLAIGALLPVHDNQAKASRKYNGRRHQKKTPNPALKDAGDNNHSNKRWQQQVMAIVIIICFNVALRIELPVPTTHHHSVAWMVVTTILLRRG